MSPVYEIDFDDALLDLTPENGRPSSFIQNVLTKNARSTRADPLGDPG